MTLLRRFFPVLLLLAAAPLIHAQPLSCSASATPKTVRAEGTHELVADIVVTCTGGEPTPNGGAIPKVNFTLSTGDPITSRPLPGLSPEPWSEALLLVDEPAPANQNACTDGSGVCNMLGAPSPTMTYDGSSGRYNIFQGLQYTGSELVFLQVPFDQPGGTNTRVLRFTNVRVRVTPESPQVTFAVTSSFTIDNSTVIVAIVTASTSATTQAGVGGPNGVTSFQVVLSELIPGAWKTRTIAPFAGNDTSPTPVDQNTPGTAYPTESGFHDAGAYLLVNRSLLSQFGLAYSGTRLTVRVDATPPYITVHAPLVVNLMKGAIITGVARRIDNVGMDGVGAFAPRSQTQMDFDNDFSQMYAHYEILSTSPDDRESVTIPITINYLPMAVPMPIVTGLAGLAPDEAMSAPFLPGFHRLELLEVEATAPPPPPPPVIQTTSLPATLTGAPYSAQLVAADGTPPYVWSAQGLPSGLTLSGNGALSGAITTPGEFSFNVMVTDSTQQQDTQALSVTVIGPVKLLTTSPLPTAKAQKPYSANFEASGGQGPYTFSLNGPGIPGLTLKPNGTLDGNPPQQGTFQITVVVQDAVNQTDSRTYSLTIDPLPQVVAPSVVKMSFTGFLGGGMPAAQSLALVATNQQDTSFALTVEDGPGNAAAPTWLQFSLDEGAIPARLTISVNQTGLAPGTYSAKITIVQPRDLSQAPIVIEIVFTVENKAPALEVLPDTLEFSAVRAAPVKQRRTLNVRNRGGGGAISFTASIQNASSWLKLLSPPAGQTNNDAATTEIEVDSTGLVAGQYRDILRVASAAGNADIPVTLLVYEGGAVLDLGQEGVTFTTRVGSNTATPRQIRVVNRGDAGSTLHWTAQKMDATDTWFTVSPVSGLSTPLQAGTVNISLTSNAAVLAEGSYYGLVKVSDASAVDGPDYAVVVLEVKPANAPATLDLETAGVVFVAPPFDAGTRTAKVRFSANSNTNVFFQASAATENDGGWLSVTPAAGQVSGVTFTEVTISASSASLAEGIYRGEVILARGDSVRAINVTFIVAQAAAGASASAPIRAAECSPNKLALTSTAMPNHFQVPAGWPATLTVELRNNCGATVSGASVIASFTNGDPPLSLLSDGAAGVYSATWEPGTALTNVNITLRAAAAGLEPSNPLLIGSVTANVKIPKLVPNGTLHGLFPEILGSLAPGSVAQIYGSDLATVTESTGIVPLPSTYKGTRVLIGNFEAPLYYVSPEVLVVQMPNEIAPNQTASVVVEVGNAITIPEQVKIVAVKPGVAAFSTGQIIAQHSNYTLVDAQNPAKRGETLIMYLVGLGATNPPVTPGTPTPATGALARPLVEPTMTVDGQPAQVAFAGMTPFAIGLFQINFVVPPTARTGVPLEVVVKQGNVTANVTTLTLAP